MTAAVTQPILTPAQYHRNAQLFSDHYLQLNKRKIAARPPSAYMKEFKKENEAMGETMKTHLIDDLSAYGVWADDYVSFVEHRADRMLEELEKRLYPDLDWSGCGILATLINKRQLNATV
jgi:hypothetical protein